MRRPVTWATHSMLAAELAQAMGLAPGNFWEPPIARQIERQLADGVPLSAARTYWYVRLGLTHLLPKGSTDGD